MSADRKSLLVGRPPCDCCGTTPCQKAAPESIPVMRLTKCICGHGGIEHYDSHLFCTWTLSGECECAEFRAAGPEIYVQAGKAMPRA